VNDNNGATKYIPKRQGFYLEADNEEALQLSLSTKHGSIVVISKALLKL
jgi:hypothetical protein